MERTGCMNSFGVSGACVSQVSRSSFEGVVLLSMSGETKNHAPAIA